MRALGTLLLLFTVTHSLACSFDRSPLGQSALTAAGTPADMFLPDAAAPDDGAAAGGGGGGGGGAGKGPLSGAGGRAGAAGGTTPPDETDSGIDEPIPACDLGECGMPPTPGARVCCTTEADVKNRLSRGAGLCGLDLSQVNGTFGSGCWQRERLGIIDRACPNAGTELGCCADDGVCGTNNSDQRLGCRHPSGSPVTACGADAPQKACDAPGVYGMRITVDATWNGRTGGLAELTDDGRGAIQIYVKLDVRSIDPKTKQATMQARVCGVTLPPFYSTTLCESYQPVFPPELWESKAIPIPPLQGRYECTAQGCVMSVGPLTYQLGIRLDDSEAIWPTAQQTAGLTCSAQPDGQCFPDDDDDGNKGVEINLVRSGRSPSTAMSCPSGYDYRAAPMSENPAAIFDGVRRADRLGLGIRARVGAAFRFDDTCQVARGSALTQYVNSRAAGCLVEPGTFDVFQTIPAGPNAPCTDTEVAFIDASMPVYQVLSAGEMPTMSVTRKDTSASAGPIVSVRRMGMSGLPTTCEEIRNAAY